MATLDQCGKFVIAAARNDHGIRTGRFHCGHAQAERIRSPLLGKINDVPASPFMAALAALKVNPAMRASIARPKARGRLAIIAGTAAMRRLTVIKQAVLETGGEPVTDRP